jgi:hypothetical protein
VFLCLERESVTRCLGGHLSADGEVAASETGHEVSDVCICAVDYMMSVNSAAIGFNCVFMVWAPVVVDRAHWSVIRNLELGRVLQDQVRKNARNELVRPQSTRRTGNDSMCT